MPQYRGLPRNNELLLSAQWKQKTSLQRYAHARYAGYGICGQLLATISMDPSPFLGDNAACLALCSSHQVKAMAKHIRVIHHFATEQVQSGNISFKYVVRAMNASDILTNALFKPLLEQHRLGLVLQELRQMKG